jgi:hypothetical protein
MARSRSRRRPGRLTSTGAPRPRQRPAANPAAAPPAAARRGGGPGGWWRRRSNGARLGLLALLGLAVLIGVNLWLHQPPRPDASGLHADILAGRSGAEVTFTGTVVTEPANDGGHERMLVRDQLGDTLELDYNVTLGRTVPVHLGDAVAVHGQLYVDPGQAGVHCLHAQTSRGCPEPGWVQFRGTTYQ